MIDSRLKERKAAYESELGQLCYERYQLCWLIESKQQRIDEIDRRIQSLEAALRETQAAHNDLKSQTAIDQAKGESNA